MINNNIRLNMSNGMVVNVDRGNVCGVSRYEIEDQVEDLFRVKNDYKPREIIKLSTFCNCVFDLMFCSSNKENKEMSFKLC